MTHHSSDTQVGAHSTAHAAGAGTVSFADVAHQTLLFDVDSPAAQLVLRLIDTKWVQRLRRLRQTGNTSFVYMFAEHSRFGHSLGVAYLALELMKCLARFHPEKVKRNELAVAAAALLHDIGHSSPGSHLAERVWSSDRPFHHEELTVRIIREDEEIRTILERTQAGLTKQVTALLSKDTETTPPVAPWARAVISGGGWNADRGNWTLVDSAMCSVSYGRYNVTALIDSFRLSADDQLVLMENRLDALTHFFVARDSMYRQVYQHRVSQAADAMTARLIVRLRDLLPTQALDPNEMGRELSRQGVFHDDVLVSLLSAQDFTKQTSLENVFSMTENWWGYCVERWSECPDEILADLSRRLRDRELLKTLRINDEELIAADHDVSKTTTYLKAKELCIELGMDPRYYVTVVDSSDRHRSTEDQAPFVLLDSGRVCPVTEVEPLVASLLDRPERHKVWVALPKKVKALMGKSR